MSGFFWLLVSIIAIIVVVRLIGIGISSTARNAGFDTTPLKKDDYKKETSAAPFEGYRTKYFSEYEDVDAKLNNGK